MPLPRSPLLCLVLVLATAPACGGDEAHDIVHQGCEQDADCLGGQCIEGLPGGLCTSNCSAQEDCPEGTVCTDTEAASDGICLFPCTDTQECLDNVGSGYVCDTESNLSTGEDILVCIDS